MNTDTIMNYRGIRIACLLAVLLLSGCVSNSLPPQMRHQNAVTQTGAHMALKLADAAHWGKDAGNQLILVSQPAIYSPKDISGPPPVRPEQLRNALVYGILHLKYAPHVVAWSPNYNSQLEENQWRLEARMFNKQPQVLKHHTLYPYRLEMRLFHPHQRPLSLVVEGTFDSNELKVDSTSNSD